MTSDVNTCHVICIQSDCVQPSALSGLSAPDAIHMMCQAARFCLDYAQLCTPASSVLQHVTPETCFFLRHMSLLGLPDDVVRELAAEHIEPGRVRALYAYFFKLDLNASIRKSSRLMQLHSTAETFDRAAETLFTRLQVHNSSAHRRPAARV